MYVDQSHTLIKSTVSRCRQQLNVIRKTNRTHTTFGVTMARSRKHKCQYLNLGLSVVNLILWIVPKVCYFVTISEKKLAVCRPSFQAANDVPVCQTGPYRSSSSTENSNDLCLLIVTAMMCRYLSPRNEFIRICWVQSFITKITCTLLDLHKFHWQLCAFAEMKLIYQQNSNEWRNDQIKIVVTKLLSAIFYNRK